MRKISIKSSLKKKLKHLIIMMLLNILIVIIIAGAIMGIAEGIKNFFVNTWNSLFGKEQEYTDTRNAMQELLESADEKDLENLPIEKSLLKKILEAEESTISKNKVIEIESKIVINTTTIEKEKKDDKDDTDDENNNSDESDSENSKDSNESNENKVENKNTVHESETKYIKSKAVLNYNDITNQYRVPWQLILGITILKEGDEKFVDDLIEKLRPKYKYITEYDKSTYSYEELKNMETVNYRQYETKKTKRYTNKTVKTVKDKFLYCPVVAIDTVETYLYKYKYTYKKVPLENNEQDDLEYGFDYTIDTIEIEENKDKFYNLLKTEYEFTESTIDTLIEFIRRLPDGEYIAFELKDTFDRYKYVEIEDREFSPDIPMIEGNWKRHDLVRTAMSLQGLDYFWGGKYPNKGTNPNWGKKTLVTSAGNWATGTYKRLGLDCSGFVEWVYYQMLGKSISDYGGTYSMWVNSYAISEEELKPGDIGFYQKGGGKHVGIYIGKIDGVRAFIHAGGRTWKDDAHPTGQVIVTKQYERYNGYPPSKFKYFRRFPVKFADDNY